MGLVISKAIPYYHREDVPETVDLTPRVKTHQAEYANFKQFDDNVLLKPSMSHHIIGISAFFGEYLVGLKVDYMLNGRVKTMEHFGDGDIHQEEMISCDKFEHIQYISISYSSEGIHSFRVKTNCNKEMRITGSKGRGKETKSLKLTNLNKAIIGFRGSYDGPILRDLYVYLA